MTNKETINRNIGLAFDLLHKINRDPALLNKIPNGTTIEFVEKEDVVTKKRKYIMVKNGFEI